MLQPTTQPPRSDQPVAEVRANLKAQANLAAPVILLRQKSQVASHASSDHRANHVKSASQTVKVQTARARRKTTKLAATTHAMIVTPATSVAVETATAIATVIVTATATHATATAAQTTRVTTATKLNQRSLQTTCLFREPEFLTCSITMRSFAPAATCLVQTTSMFHSAR